MLAELPHRQPEIMWLHILTHGFLAAAEALSPPPPEAERLRKEANKNSLFAMVVFCLIGMGAMAVVSCRTKHTDILSGRTAVEGFMRANVTAFIIMFVCLIVYIVLMFWSLRRGRKCLMMIIAGLAPVMFMIVFTLSSHNINEDLKHPRETRVSEYVLCTGQGQYYVGFEDKGEYILLALPHEDFQELAKGQEEPTHSDSDIYMMIKGSEYTVYSDPRLYSTRANIEYYFNSAIYLGSGLEG